MSSAASSNPNQFNNTNNFNKEIELNSERRRISKIGLIRRRQIAITVVTGASLTLLSLAQRKDSKSFDAFANVNGNNKIEINNNYDDDELSGKIDIGNRRLIAIGDVHGDFPAMMKALEIAEVMDKNGQWIGKDSVVVQVGDVLDRGDCELAIFTKLMRLKKKARSEGGNVIVMNGNHEIMNVMGDFRYATNGAYLECGEYLEKLKKKEIVNNNDNNIKINNNVENNKENNKENDKTINDKKEEEMSPLKQAEEKFRKTDPIQQGIRARRELFQPGGVFAMKLSKHPTVLQVGETIFAHAGVNPNHVNYGFDRINKEVSLWMQGKLKSPPSMIVESEGVVWTREYGGKDAGVKYEAEACRRLKSAMELTSEPQAKRLVIGHTPQTSGVNSGCKGAVWRVDVGASRGIYGGAVEVLEIKGNRVRVLS
jgi:uncharacterized protein YheU (UPF0270 family)